MLGALVMPQKQAVAWCPACEYWVGIAELGNRCIGDGTCQYRLVRRVGYICLEQGLHRLCRGAVACEGGHY